MKIHSIAFDFKSVFMERDIEEYHVHFSDAGK